MCVVFIFLVTHQLSEERVTRGRLIHSFYYVLIVCRADDAHDFLLDRSEANFFFLTNTRRCLGGENALKKYFSSDRRV